MDQNKRQCESDNFYRYLYSVPDTPGSLFIYKFTRIPQIRYVNILLQRENHSNSAVQNLYHTV
jgi:hypothetical protein